MTNYKPTILTLCIFLIMSLNSLSALSANKTDSENSRFTINTGSFLYHLYNPNDSKYTELFDNQYLSAGVRVSDSSYIIAGTFLNSFGKRCALLGLENNLYDFNSRLSFKGLYAYAGEFFFDAFDDCKNRGVYKRFHKAVGVGFAPYIYHGVEYKLNSVMSLEGGLIIPGLAVASVRWRF